MAHALFLAALLITTAGAQPGRFGLPACNAPDQTLATRTAFTLCLSQTHNAPLWAVYELTPSMLHAAAPRQQFRHDSTLSATNADYRGSGYHRSHLVPASDIASNAQALRESYLLSNAVPQLAELNLSAWRKIENDIRRLAEQSDAVYVFTGALFDCAELRHIGPNQVAVPCATYKVVLAVQGDKKTAFAVVLRNEPGARRETTTIREVETRAALDFFSALPLREQDELESSVTPLR